MKEKITFNDLILFAFNETYLEKTVAVVDAIETDPGTSNAFNGIKEVLSVLTPEESGPSDKIIKNILKHS